MDGENCVSVSNSLFSIHHSLFSNESGPPLSLERAGRNTGDNLLSHLSEEALPSAVYRLNERVRDGDVCFPAPMLTRASVPNAGGAVIAFTHPGSTEKMSIHRIASSR